MSGMRSLDDFFRYVRLDVPEIGIPIVRQALNEAAREFCKKTGIWEEKNRLLSLAPGRREYKVPVHEQGRLQDVIQLSRRIENRDPEFYADRLQFKRTEADLDHELQNWRNFTNPRAEFLHWGITVDREHIFITPTPEIAYPNGVRYTFTMYPNQDAFEVIDILYEEYAEQISAGAAAILLRIPNKPWTNSDAADNRDLKFTRGISVAWRKTHTAQNRLKFRRLGS